MALEGLWADPERGVAGWGDRPLQLSSSEVAVLAALVEARGRVVPRSLLARRAGLATSSDRRCDSVLVGLRRAIGHDVVHNVRRRGWRLVMPPTLGAGGSAPPVGAGR